ncbi:DUF2797 domain-containing protein [Candidatus Peribacteria bacterium]|nr:DUF2797 domain-containing protein [Candidatus Peribacteria bacterium]
MNLQLFAYRWHDDAVTELQAIADGRYYGTRPVRLGETMSITRVSEKHCAGYRREGVWHPCTSGSPAGKAQCDSCGAKEGSFVFTVFDGFDQSALTAEDLQRLQHPTQVYLALFDREIIKVGVTASHRGDRRQWEQGSSYTAYIADVPDGITARQIETLVRRLGVADKVPASKKHSLVLPPVDAAEATVLLQQLYERIQTEAFTEHPHLQSFLSPTLTVQDWGEVYGTAALGISPAAVQHLELQVGEGISGTVRAMKGVHLLLEAGDEWHSLCMKDLYGCGVDCAERATGTHLQTATQKSLF